MEYEDYEDIGLQLVQNNNIEKADNPEYLYGCVPIDLLHKDLLSPASLRVYIYLMRSANKKGYCYPSQQKMANELGYERHAIVKAIKELVDKKIIIKKTVKKENNQESNVYATPVSVAFKKPSYFSSIVNQKVLNKKVQQAVIKSSSGCNKSEQKEYNKRIEKNSSKDTTKAFNALDYLEESKGNNGTAYSRLIHSWTTFLYDYPLRKADIDNLDKITVDDWLLHHITLWPRFLNKSDDKYIQQSDGSLSVLVNNLQKFKQFVEHDSLRYMDYVNKENPFKLAVSSAKYFQENMNINMEVYEDDKNRTRYIQK